MGNYESYGYKGSKSFRHNSLPPETLLCSSFSYTAQIKCNELAIPKAACYIILSHLKSVLHPSFAP